MATASNSRALRTISLLLTICLCSVPVYGKYGGGTGEPNDPYQVATAADLMLLGETPEDYDKHFILTADIDLDPNLPGRKIFHRAVVAADMNDVDRGFQGTPFNGVLDGNGHTISHLTIKGGGSLGLFGLLESGAEVRDLGVAEVNIAGSRVVGGLAGASSAVMIRCYSTGVVSGSIDVGGLVGSNGGAIRQCYSKGVVSGGEFVGGLVGGNGGSPGSVSQCYSTAAVDGYWSVGGLVGYNMGVVAHCYSAGPVISTGDLVGGLVASNCFVTGPMGFTACGGHVANSFWDIESSGQATSDGGTGLRTAEMHEVRTYLDAGWDWMDEIENGTSQIWRMPDEGGYPVLAMLSGCSLPELQGLGTMQDPYLISDVLDLGAITHYSSFVHYRLTRSIDLSGIRWGTAVIPSFGGTFDGNDLTIARLTIKGGGSLGLFGLLESGAVLANLGVVDVNVTGSYDNVGGLVGRNKGGNVTHCYSTGMVTGHYYNVGGLVGRNSGNITMSYTAGTVDVDGDNWGIGGLVGRNTEGGSISSSYSAAVVSGDQVVGGLVGHNDGRINTSYSTGSVNGDRVGGLVGGNFDGNITGSYSAGSVTGHVGVGGLVGDGGSSGVTLSFWDVEESGQSDSSGGTGLTTAQMQTANTFQIWGTCENEGIWAIDEGRDYPRLWWQNSPGEPIAVGTTLSGFLTGEGTEDSPYLIYTPDELNLIGLFPCDWDKHFRLMADIDLSDFSYGAALIAPNTGSVPFQFEGTAFTGVFDGNGHTISHLTIRGESYLGLFGGLSSGAMISNLGLDGLDIAGTDRYVGGLVGYNVGIIANSYGTGKVGGEYYVGGLVGVNYGIIATSYRSGEVSATLHVGGLVGYNGGNITTSYSTGTVSGNSDVGGLVGRNWDGSVSACFWDAETSGLFNMCGRQVGNVVRCDDSYGLTTAEMQTASTFLNAGWDFVDEVANGTDDIWWILEGQDYPRLWWEAIPQN